MKTGKGGGPMDEGKDRSADGGCGCDSGGCCGGGRPGGVMQWIRFVVIVAIVAMAAFLVVRGMKGNQAVVPGAGQAAGTGHSGGGK